MQRLFGTDGIRARAGKFPLDDETVFKIGAATARYLRSSGILTPKIITGRDTRESGERIEGCFHSGAVSENAACRSSGIIPTPGVAYLTGACGFDAGVVISASHNSFDDNGIKIFLPTGKKLEDTAERSIELDVLSCDLPAGGIVSHEPDASDESRYKWSYLGHFLREFKGLELGRRKIIVDCANGAAFELAPCLIEMFGGNIIAINSKPNGRNINDNCGSTCIADLSAAVVREKANLGIAFDGDADRALFVDSKGNVVDGDAVLWILANYFDSCGLLPSKRIVSTVMSNIGLEIALAKRGLKLFRTDVGDKFVLDELLRNGGELGGEQSGHIIFPRSSLAGDGIRTALFVLKAICVSRASLAKLAKGFVRFPQTLVNICVRKKIAFEDIPEIAAASKRIGDELDGRGRLLLRYSGTEDLARVMIEGEDQQAIEHQADFIATVIRGKLG